VLSDAGEKEELYRVIYDDGVQHPRDAPGRLVHKQETVLGDSNEFTFHYDIRTGQVPATCFGTWLTVIHRKAWVAIIILLLLVCSVVGSSTSMSFSENSDMENIRSELQDYIDELNRHNGNDDLFIEEKQDHACVSGWLCAGDAFRTFTVLDKIEDSKNPVARFIAMPLSAVAMPSTVAAAETLNYVIIFSRRVRVIGMPPRNSLVQNMLERLINSKRYSRGVEYLYCDRASQLSHDLSCIAINNKRIARQVDANVASIYKRVLGLTGGKSHQELVGHFIKHCKIMKLPCKSTYLNALEDTSRKRLVTDAVEGLLPVCSTGSCKRLLSCKLEAGKLTLASSLVAKIAGPQLLRDVVKSNPWGMNVRRDAMILGALGMSGDKTFRPYIAYRMRKANSLMLIATGMMSLQLLGDQRATQYYEKLTGCTIGGVDGGVDEYLRYLGKHIACLRKSRYCEQSCKDLLSAASIGHQAMLRTAAENYEYGIYAKIVEASGRRNMIELRCIIDNRQNAFVDVDHFTRYHVIGDGVRFKIDNNIYVGRPYVEPFEVKEQYLSIDKDTVRSGRKYKLIFDNGVTTNDFTVPECQMQP